MDPVCEAPAPGLAAALEDRPAISAPTPPRAAPPEERAAGSAAAPSRRAAYQRALFGSRELPVVVPFESLSPTPAVRPVPSSGPQKRRARRSLPGQQTLDFAACPPRAAEVFDRAVEPVIFCNAPVAVPAHRLLAAAVDLSVIVIALGAFFGVFHLFGGEVLLTRQTMPLFGLIAAVFCLLYKVLWFLADGDSPGMRFARLRLINFDGRRPDREQRLYRIASACLSSMAAGLGIVWALVDEESLTWHDHISKTFPTPY